MLILGDFGLSQLGPDHGSSTERPPEALRTHKKPQMPADSAQSTAGQHRSGDRACGCWPSLYDGSTPGPGFLFEVIHGRLDAGGQIAR
jgi:hypothetical protein